MRLRIAIVLLLFISLLAPAAVADKPAKPPEGMRKYFLFLRKARPVPPGEKPEKIKEPDIEKLGGIVVETLEDYKVVFLPPSAAKHLRRDRDVVHLQRVWMGESFDDWDETDSGSSFSASELTEETDLKWGPKQYEYDGVGNISEITDQTLGSSDRFTYDAVSRLTRAEMHGTTETYEYDSFGNITKKQISGQSPVPMTVDSTSNRLSTQTYDVAGNVTSTDGQPVYYYYDSLGMMSGYSGNSRNRRMYYTADDERIGTQWHSNTSHWTIRDFDGRVLREFRLGSYGAGNWIWVEDYIYADGRLVAGESINTYAPDKPELRKRHFHLDHLGTVRLVTSEQGKLSLGRHDYYPFGTEKTVFYQEEANFGGWGGTLPEKMRFTGHERDFLGFWNVENTDYLDYMHARYYNPNQGRFLSVDPGKDWDPRRPQSWNLYSYVRNNPINAIDPDGRAMAMRHIMWFLGLEPEVRDTVALVASAIPGVDEVQDAMTAATGVDFSLNPQSNANRAISGAALLLPIGGKLIGEVVGSIAKHTNWGKASTLTDHFVRHGAELGARNMTEYAQMGSDFLKRSQAEKLPTKVDANGVTRVYDAKTNTFASYNPDGTTRTIYKPDPNKHKYKTNQEYWDAQPGKLQ